MALDESALLDVLEALKGADVEDRIKQAATTIYRPESITVSSRKQWWWRPVSPRTGAARCSASTSATALVSDEDGAFWTAFLRSLETRGLTSGPAGVQLVISDAHRGLVEAIGATLPGTVWQRCL